MTNIYYVYQLRRVDSLEPFYIGKGKGERSQKHFQQNCLAKKSIKNNIINKATKEGVDVVSEILSSNLSENAAFALERLLIAAFGRKDKKTGILANMTDGGDGTAGLILPPMTEDHKKKLAAANRGKVPSEITRKRISESGKGRIVTESTRTKLSEAHKGKVFSEETRRLIGEANAALPKKTCEHCGGSFAPALYGRHHGERCKLTGYVKPVILSNSGSANSFAKLTEDNVRSIRSMASSGATSKELSIIFNVSESNICRIVRRASWRHLA